MPVRVGMIAATNYRPAELRQIARLCRLSGVDALLAPDHWQDLMPRAIWHPPVTWRTRQLASPHEHRESFTTLGALAPFAGRVRLGTAVTEFLRRHPVMVAQAALTLSELTRQPPIIGVGAGERMNTAPYGLDDEKPVRRLEEALEIIRLCWTSSGPIDYHGDHFTLTDAVFDLSVPPGAVPEIWVAAHGPRMLGITGRLADGWIPSAPPIRSPSDYENALHTIRRAAEDAGRDPGAITPSMFLSVAVAPTARGAASLLDTTLLKYWAVMGASAAQWSEFGADHPFGHDFKGYIELIPEAIEPEEMRAAVRQAPREVVASIVFTGTPRQLEARIREYAEAGLRHIVLAPISALYRRRYQNYFVWALPQLIRRLRR